MRANLYLFIKAHTFIFKILPLSCWKCTKSQLIKLGHFQGKYFEEILQDYEEILQDFEEILQDYEEFQNSDTVFDVYSPSKPNQDLLL